VTLAEWLILGLGKGWQSTAVDWAGLDDAVRALAPGDLLTQRALLPVGEWSLLLTDGPLGTDPGMLPSQAARQLRIPALDATCIDDGDHPYPGRSINYYDPQSTDLLCLRRSIAAYDDGGRWQFDVAGEPWHFEQVDRYKSRRKSARFTSEMLYSYLGSLNVPYQMVPSWSETIVVHLM
jgi:hypothetical protein